MSFISRLVSSIWALSVINLYASYPLSSILVAALSLIISRRWRLFVCHGELASCPRVFFSSIFVLNLSHHFGMAYLRHLDGILLFRWLCLWGNNIHIYSSWNSVIINRICDALIFCVRRFAREILFGRVKDLSVSLFLLCFVDHWLKILQPWTRQVVSDFIWVLQVPNHEFLGALWFH